MITIPEEDESALLTSVHRTKSGLGKRDGNQREEQMFYSLCFQRYENLNFYSQLLQKVTDSSTFLCSDPPTSHRLLMRSQM